MSNVTPGPFSWWLDLGSAFSSLLHTCGWPRSVLGRSWLDVCSLFNRVGVLLGAADADELSALGEVVVSFIHCTHVVASPGVI